jgi:predicted O-linked N-acetylglucosamine transferase (SPINDLY family)
MDFRLTDLHADPPGMTEAQFTEKLIRVPGCAWCYRPDDAAPSVAPPPSESAGHVTFGSFNKRQKISQTTMRMWARLLSEVTGARLIIKSPILHDESARRLLKEALVQLGIAADRVELVGRSRSMVEHLHHYERVDVALDTTPYNGTTTTCDALWMGVPVVTLAGDRHISRVGVSLLNNAQLGDLVATSADEFVAIAAELARDVDRRRTLRARLREQLRRSPLMDGKALAAGVEAELRKAWT